MTHMRCAKCGTPADYVPRLQFIGERPFLSEPIGGLSVCAAHHAQIARPEDLLGDGYAEHFRFVFWRENRPVPDGLLLEWERLYNDRRPR